MRQATVRDYIELCKPRVVLLMILTSIVGMCLAPSPSFPVIPMILGNCGIALVAAAAAVLNHIADQHIDKLMHRTQHRPIVQGKISTTRSLYFAGILCFVGMLILFIYINVLTAILTFLCLMGYAVCYTLYLKHATPQNIVIGGIAGAIPPLLGWTSVTGVVSPEALILVLIIYVWTPPHFWALAIYRLEDYAKANVPMLPNTHGVAFTKLSILLYTILLICVSTLPYIINMSGMLYLIGVFTVDALFLYYVVRLYYSNDNKHALLTFKYSIHYLGLVFLLLLVDHYDKKPVAYMPKEVKINGVFLAESKTIKDFQLTDHKGKAFSKDNLMDHWTIMFFGFTHCGYVCPTTMTELNKMYKKLKIELPENKLPQVVLVTVDPARDSQSRMKDFVNAFNADFRGVRADLKDTEVFERQLHITAVKVQEKNQPKDQYSVNHSAEILLFNPKGQLQAYLFFPPKADRLVRDYKVILATFNDRRQDVIS